MTDETIFQQHADSYARHTERSGPNVSYDRPEILRLAGDLRGKRVLELGCASGVLTEQLAGRGASVVAVDREPKLVDLARRRLGNGAEFVVADLAQPPPLASSGSIDDYVVIASLVLHYIEDWGPVLGELRRCLAPGGALVFSIHHPVTGWLLSDRSDYHRTELVSEDWDWDGSPVTGRMYRRPLGAIFGPLRENGFLIDAVTEPRPRDSDALDAHTRQVLHTQPVFLYFRAIRGS